MREPYYANTLIKVALPTHQVTAPGEDRAGVVLFPRPHVKEASGATSRTVTYDIGCWFVHDVLASTLPLYCFSQNAAQRLTDLWSSNVATGTVDPRSAEQVANWCKWYVEEYPGCAVLVPMPPAPAGDSLVTAVIDALSTVTSAASGPANTERPAAMPATNDSSAAWPIEDQADDTTQEAAS